MGGNVYMQLVIATKSLSNGSHAFDFQLDNSFFAAFDNTEILTADLTVTVDVRKIGPMQIEVQVSVKGEVEVPCDRCLDNVSLPITFAGALEEEEVMENMDSDTGELDLTQYVYDSVCVSLPLQRTHAPGSCNKEMVDLWQQNSSHVAKENSAFEGLKDLLK